MLTTLNDIFHILLDLDLYLEIIINTYPLGAYLIIGLLLFAEPGLFMPYLPGDTVIFIAATFATTDALSYPLLWLTIFIFSVLGDTLNYGMGYWFGHYITQRKNRRFIKNNHLEQTRQFYQKYGGKTILFSRYIPVIRSFAPFLGGVGELPFKKYLLFDLLGVFLWSGLYLNLGYFFGAIPWVQDNLAIVIPVVVVGTMIPAFIVTRVTKKDMQKDMQKEPNKAE